ncbi:MAG: hypothetical protein LGB54_05895 [Sulfurovum sp.]|nr:hypothetical protein [Sulfurovum sp.]MCB4784561.1 hypothetical protein [Sulfurovum sp.]
MQGMEEVMINSHTGIAPARISHLRKYMQWTEAVMINSRIGIAPASFSPEEVHVEDGGGHEGRAGVQEEGDEDAGHAGALGAVEVPIQLGKVSYGVHGRVDVALPNTTQHA